MWKIGNQVKELELKLILSLLDLEFSPILCPGDTGFPRTGMHHYT